MATDGVFTWFYGRGGFPEVYHSGGKDRDSTIAMAKADDLEETGFTICEADKAVPSTDIFDADIVLEQYDEANVECWGEDGSDIAPEADLKRELEQALSDTLNAWMTKHGQFGTVWSFGEMRNEEYFAPQALGGGNG